MDEQQPLLSRVHAIWGLGLSGDVSVLPMLRELLATRELKLVTKSALGTHGTAQALSILLDSGNAGFYRIPNVEILEFLKNELPRSKYEHSVVLDGIVAVAGPEAVGILKGFLSEDTDEALFIQVVEHLRMKQSAAATDAMLSYLETNSKVTYRHLQVVGNLSLYDEGRDGIRLIDWVVRRRLTNKTPLSRAICRAVLKVLSAQPSSEVRNRLEQGFREHPTQKWDEWKLLLLAATGSRLALPRLLEHVQNAPQYRSRIRCIVALLALHDTEAFTLATNELEDGLKRHLHIGLLCWGLGKYAGQKALKDLCKAFVEGRSRGEWFAGYWLLRSPSPEIVEAIATAWRHWARQKIYPAKRKLALEILAKCRTPLAISVLIEASAQFGVKAPESNAASYLDQIDNPHAREILLENLNNLDGPVCDHICTALARIGGVDTLLGLIQARGGQALWEGDPPRIADQKVIQALHDNAIIQELLLRLGSRQRSERQRALIALRFAPNKEQSAQEVITEVRRLIDQETDEDVLCKAVAALAAFGGENVTDDLRDMLRTGRSEAVRETAASGLLALGTKIDVPALLEESRLRNILIPQGSSYTVIPSKYLCGLLANMPFTKPFLHQFCLDHGIRVQIDGNIVTYSGHVVSCQDAQEELNKGQFISNTTDAFR